MSNINNNYYNCDYCNKSIINIDKRIRTCGNCYWCIDCFKSWIIATRSSCIKCNKKILTACYGPSFEYVINIFSFLVDNWEVDSIIGERNVTENREIIGVEYKIRWKGFSSKEDSWIKGNELECDEIIQDWQLLQAEKKLNENLTNEEDEQIEESESDLDDIYDDQGLVHININDNYNDHFIGQKPYYCSTCRVTIKNPKNYAKHVNDHLNNKTIILHTCKVCRLNYLVKTNLNRHSKNKKHCQ